MKALINFSRHLVKLKEGLIDEGHVVVEEIWDIREILKEGVSAAVFGFKSIFKNKIRFLKLAHELKKHNLPVVTWNVDSPWNMGISKWQVDLFLRSGLFDLYATHSLQDTEGITKTKVVYLPNAVNSAQYNLKNMTLNELRAEEFYKWDVSFLGNIDSKNYPEHKTRVSFLRDLKDRLSKKDISFLFLDTDSMSVTEQIDIIQKSRINLSCISASDSKGVQSWGLTERCYGIPYCGGFLLMEERTHVKDDFVLAKEAVTYKGLDECVEKILFYLPRHEERRRIAEAAYARVVREHTYRHRAKKLVYSLEDFIRC